MMENLLLLSESSSNYDNIVFHLNNISSTFRVQLANFPVSVYSNTLEDNTPFYSKQKLIDNLSSGEYIQNSFKYFIIISNCPFSDDSLLSFHSNLAVISSFHLPSINNSRPLSFLIFFFFNHFKT